MSEAGGHPQDDATVAPWHRPPMDPVIADIDPFTLPDPVEEQLRRWRADIAAPPTVRHNGHARQDISSGSGHDGQFPGVPVSGGSKLNGVNGAGPDGARFLFDGHGTGPPRPPTSALTTTTGRHARIETDMPWDAADDQPPWLTAMRAAGATSPPAPALASDATGPIISPHARSDPARSDPARSDPAGVPAPSAARASTAAAAAPAIVASHLRKQFKDMVAVDDVSFTVAPGSIVALLGPNGAGKTTTLNMLCTLLKPDGGSAQVHGHDVVHDAPAVRRSIMLTGQFAALDEALTGRENLVLFGKLLGLSKQAAHARADELLDTFDLTHVGGKRVGQYSGGMRRRIDIACGLVIAPKVVFLDEPTTGLDPRSRMEVWSLVERLRDAGVTILLTTQYLEEADVLSDRIVVIDKGRVIAQGTADELKTATGAAYCEVTPVHAADLPRLHDVLADLIPVTAKPADNHAISVPATAGADTLVEVINRTSAAKIELSDVAMRRPSLDEVFLALTEPARAPSSADSVSAPAGSAPTSEPR